MLWIAHRPLVGEVNPPIHRFERNLPQEGMVATLQIHHFSVALSPLNLKCRGPIDAPGDMIICRANDPCTSKRKAKLQNDRFGQAQECGPGVDEGIERHPSNLSRRNLAAFGALNIGAIFYDNRHNNSPHINPRSRFNDCRVHDVIVYRVPCAATACGMAALRPEHVARGKRSLVVDNPGRPLPDSTTFSRRGHGLAPLQAPVCDGNALPDHPLDFRFRAQLRTGSRLKFLPPPPPMR